MKKTFAAILTVLAMLVALVLPAMAFSETTADEANVRGVATTLEDGEYAVGYTLTTETGTTKPVVPVRLLVQDGSAYAKIAFNDPEIDKLYLDDIVYLPVDFTSSHNIKGKLPIFILPLSGFQEDQSFIVHTRGCNLPEFLDTYTLNVKDYDANFDADVQAAEVQESISGAQPVKFYHWQTGGASKAIGPFIFLAVVALAIACWDYFDKKRSNQ